MSRKTATPAGIPIYLAVGSRDPVELGRAATQADLPIVLQLADFHERIRQVLKTPKPRKAKAARR